MRTVIKQLVPFGHLNNGLVSLTPAAE